MANKTDFSNAIDTALSIVITKAKLLLGLDNVTNELYSDAVTDSSETETYTTLLNENISYTVTFKKTGNNTMAKFSFTNNTSSVLPSQTIFNWKNNEFKPKATVNNFRFGAYKFNGSRLDLTLNDTGVISNTGLSSNSTYETEFINYIAQD